ncbi:hypothetical protein BG005_009755 [Podila minutissima]|nr:hypothetical protein BG005_009755 [Podila minutissima]
MFGIKLSGAIVPIKSKENSITHSLNKANVMELTSALMSTIQEDKDLSKSVKDMVASHPDTAPVVARLLEFIQAKITKASASDPKRQGGIAQFFSKTTATSSSASTPSIPSTPDNTSSSIPPTTQQQPLGPVVYTSAPLSFLHPVRKKLVLAFTATELALVSATSDSSTIPASDIVVRAPFDAVHRVVAVPFLERATKHTAILIFFKHAKISNIKDAIWAVPLADDGKDFALTFHSANKQLAGLTEDLTKPDAATKTPIAITNHKRPDQLLIATLSYLLQRSVGPSLYASIDMIPLPTGPSYPNFPAHLKSNQGTIYLLPTGMLFAFRKPVLYLPTRSIEAVGIHSVLSRTFDFEVVMDRAVATVEDLDGMPPVGKDGRTCVGFGMVETKVFGKMEEWITKSGIRDRSMSEDLKAKDKAPSSASKKRAAEDEDEEGQEGAVSQGKKRQQTEANGDDDSDDEEDEDFAPESEDEVMEEYDENYGNSESEGEGGQGTSKVAKHVEQDDDEVDLGEESLGEDDDDDEEEEGDDEGDEEGDEEEEEDELLDD